MKAKSTATPTKNAARNHAASPQAQHLAKAHAAVKSLVESPGRPLDPKTQDAMQSRFGYDFSSVRVHADDKASESARMLGAHAYTTGRHIAFGDGKYAPHTNGGRNLVAHELTHVVQQARGPVQGTAHGNLSISHPTDSHERAANRRASDVIVASGLAKPLSPLPSSAPASGYLPVQRKFDLSTVLGIAGSSAVAGVAASVYSKKDPITADRINKASSVISGLAPSLSAALKPAAGAPSAGVTVKEEGKFPVSGLPTNIGIDDYRANVGMKSCKILELTTHKDKADVAPIFLNLVTYKNASIISATLDYPGKKGYPGGNGSSAEVHINYQQLTMGDRHLVAVEMHGTNAFSKSHKKQVFMGSVIVSGDGTVVQGVSAQREPGEEGTVQFNGPSENHLYLAVDYNKKGARFLGFFQESDTPEPPKKPSQ